MNKNRFDRFTFDEKVHLLACLGAGYCGDAIFREAAHALGLDMVTGWMHFNSKEQYQVTVENIKNKVKEKNERYALYLKLKEEFGG